MFIENLKKSRCVVAMTGAGVSVGSGIPDFRSSNGLFSMISQQTFELDFFTSQPAEYYKIAKQYIHTLADKKPNITHEMLAELENKGFLNAIITQNIDRLHQKAGSRNVIEFHGNVASFHCVQCFNPYVRKQVDSKIDSVGTPKCDKCGSLIRPDIVFYGDMIPEDVLNKSGELCGKCDLFIVLGTSLVVNPAAALTETAHYNGAKVIIITKGITPYDKIALHKFEVELEEFSRGVLDNL
ncbi:MAG: Sir2 family NAD-dependent protein deacetylase [Phycisphaerales bacterium]